jgi:hypothetical protein
MRRVIAVIALLFFCGCVIDLHGNGEFGFRSTSQWAFYHATEKADETQSSRSELSSQPLLDYIAEIDAAEVGSNGVATDFDDG